MEISKKHAGERTAESGPGAGALASAGLKPASHISVASVNEAESSKPRTLASWWSPFMKWEGEMGGIIWNPNLSKEPSVQAETERQTQGNTVSFVLHGEGSAMHSPSACPVLKAEIPGVPIPRVPV